MTFAVAACGHSGTMFLATQLGKAKGWTVKHEADETFSYRLANERFATQEKYGEVNSYLLSCLMQLKVDKKAILLRNPYDICQSISRNGYGQFAVNYVRECVSMLDGLASQNVPVFLFRKIVSDPEYLSACAEMLGVDLPASEIDVKTIINRQHGTPQTLTFNAVTQLEFNEFMERYAL